MKQPVNLIEYRCDSCGTTVYGDQEGLPTRGYYGTVNEMLDSGAIGGEWYACRRACLRAAVLAVLDTDAAPAAAPAPPSLRSASAHGATGLPA